MSITWLAHADCRADDGLSVCHRLTVDVLGQEASEQRSKRNEKQAKDQCRSDRADFRFTPKHSSLEALQLAAELEASLSPPPEVLASLSRAWAKEDMPLSIGDWLEREERILEGLIR